MTLAQASQRVTPQALAHAINATLRRELGLSGASTVIDHLVKLQQTDARGQDHE